MSEKVICANDISKSFLMTSGKNAKKSEILVALNNISFEILKGQTVGIIGFNGSGKTTLLRIISGIYSPDSGQIQVKGKIAPLLQLGTGFNNELNAVENIIVYGLLLGFTKSEISSKINSTFYPLFLLLLLSENLATYIRLYLNYKLNKSICNYIL